MDSGRRKDRQTWGEGGRVAVYRWREVLQMQGPRCLSRCLEANGYIKAGQTFVFKEHTQRKDDNVDSSVALMAT